MHCRRNLTATTLLLLGALIRPAPAQSAVKLDADQFFAGWNQIERYPPRAEKGCVGDAILLYAPGDKPNSLQMVSACAVKDGNWYSWNYRGTLNLNDGGRFKLITFWPFSAEYQIIAIAPDYSWALVGSKNHHSLWVLAKAATLPPEVIAGIEAKAAAAGFDITKLKKMPQTQRSQTPLNLLR